MDKTREQQLLELGFEKNEDQQIYDFYDAATDSDWYVNFWQLDKVEYLEKSWDELIDIISTDIFIGLPRRREKKIQEAIEFLTEQGYKVSR